MKPRMTTAFARLAIVLILTGCGICLTMVTADDVRGQDAGKTFEFFEPFKGEPKERIDLWGPEAQEFVKYEPNGLRITMPAGFDKERPFTGINTRIAVKGDFEIIVSYEIIKEPEVVVADKPSMKLILMAVLDRKQFNPATLTRLQLPDGEARYATYVTLTDKDTGQTKTKGANHFPAQAKSGKLRLVRKGTVLSAFVAEDPDPNFRFLKEFPNYPDEDLKYVRVLANTGNAKAAIDVRYHDLRIRWGALENAAANAPDAAAQEAFPKTASSKAWLMAGLVIGGTILLGIASALVAAWLYVRRAVVSQGALRDPGL